MNRSRWTLNHFFYSLSELLFRKRKKKTYTWKDTYHLLYKLQTQGPSLKPKGYINTVLKTAEFLWPLWHNQAKIILFLQVYSFVMDEISKVQNVLIINYIWFFFFLWSSTAVITPRQGVVALWLSVCLHSRSAMWCPDSAHSQQAKSTLTTYCPHILIGFPLAPHEAYSYTALVSSTSSRQPATVPSHGLQSVRSGACYDTRGWLSFHPHTLTLCSLSHSTRTC